MCLNACNPAVEAAILQSFNLWQHSWNHRLKVSDCMSETPSYAIWCSFIFYFGTFTPSSSMMIRFCSFSLATLILHAPWWVPPARGGAGRIQSRAESHCFCSSFSKRLTDVSAIRDHWSASSPVPPRWAPPSRVPRTTFVLLLADIAAKTGRY